MKKPGLLLLGAALLYSSAAPAQTNKSVGLQLPTQEGGLMLGSSLVVSELAFGSTNSDYSGRGVYNLSLNPKAGYFIKDNLMLGASVNANFNGSAYGSNLFSEGYHSKSIGLGVFARQYFGRAAAKDGSMNRMRFFVEAGAGISKGWSSFSTSDSTKERASFNGASFHLMPGVNYFFNNNVALEAGLKLSHSTASSNVVDHANRVGINLGLQFFLGRR